MEAFSELLSIIRMHVSIYHNAMVCGNWLLREKALGITCFHMVTVGECHLQVPGHFDGILNVGDLVIFPREIAHSMQPVASSPGSQQSGSKQAGSKQCVPQQHVPYSQSETIEGTGMLCGEIHFQHRASHQLLYALPSVFVIPNTDAHGWLTPIVKLIIQESVNAMTASDVIINRLAELLFIYALRHFITCNPHQTGVLALYAHTRIASAVNAFHLAPQRDWTLDSLAKCAAQSRTQFAKKFKEVSGWTPMEYITWWRMQLAWHHLSAGDPIAIVAEKIGYRSESSFSRVFKHTFGLGAGQVRKLAKAPGAELISFK